MKEAVIVRKLEELEAIIGRGLQSFVEVGNALLEIRDSRLYRDTHPTFEAYCKERWGMSRFYAHRLIDGAKVVEMLPVGNRPSREYQVRPLTKLPPEQQAEAWEAAVDTAPGGKVTAKHVAEVVNRRTRNPALPVYVPHSRALGYAGRAITDLENISDKDPQKKEAGVRVIIWCIKNLCGGKYVRS